MPVDPRMSEWGNPMGASPLPHGVWGERRELKHLSSARKRK